MYSRHHSMPERSRKIWKFCTATFEPCWRESLKTFIEKRSRSFWPEKKSCNIYLFFRSRRSNARRKQVSQTENGIIPRSPNNGMYEPKLYIPSTINTQINLVLLLSFGRLDCNDSTENLAKVSCIWGWLFYAFMGKKEKDNSFFNLSLKCSYIFGLNRLKQMNLILFPRT